MKKYVATFWDKLNVQAYQGKFESVARKYDTDIVAHRIIDRDEQCGRGGDKIRLAFIYSVDGEDDLPLVVARCVARALSNHEVNSLEAAYVIQVPDTTKCMEALEDVLDIIDPDCTIVASRKVMRNLYGTEGFSDIDPLRLINRLHDIDWPSGIYKTIITMPDAEVFARNEEGQLTKEASTRIGEWVHAITVGLRGRNLYTSKFDKYDYETIETLDQFEDLLDRLYAALVVAIDTETDNLNRIKNRLGTIQFAFNAQTAYILPIWHPESPFTKKQVDYILNELQLYFETAKRSVHIYANAKFDLIQLRRETKYRWYNHDVWDVQGAEYTLNENRKFRDIPLVHAVQKNKERLSAYALGQLAIEYGTTIYLSTAMGKADRSRIFATPLSEVAEYGGVDAVLTFQIYEFQKKEIASRGKAYSRTERIITKQISSMIQAFVEMELNGLPVDRVYLTREVAKGGAFREAQRKSIEELYAMDSVKQANDILFNRYVGSNMFDAHDAAKDGKLDNWVFDINTVDHQQVLFFDVLGLKPTGQGKNGNFKVDKLFKSTYAPKDDDGKLLDDIAIPEVAEFAAYGELKHLYNSFLKALYEKLYRDDDMRSDGCLRSDYMFLPIVSGRTGSRKPSLQQIPARSKLAKPIKRQFITLPGQIYVKGDYNAAEVRNWGISANEQNLANAFIRGLQAKREYRLLEIVDTYGEYEERFKLWDKKFKELDLHRQNCTLFYGVPAAEVPKPMRQKVKTLVFGTVYGMSAKRLAITLRISVEEAQELIDKLFEKFPEGGDYIIETHEFGRKYLIAVSSIGRIRHLWGYLHADYGVRGAMDRRGPNSRIQSVSSDEGCEGNYQAQRLRYELFHKQDIPLQFNICNAVHDSVESLTRIESAPIVAYLLEHAYTTCMHKAYLEYYGMEFNVGMEMDFDIGPALSEVKEWDYRPEALRKIVEDSIKWQRDELKYPVPSKDIMRKFENNLSVIDELRCTELQRMPENGVNMWMALTPKIAREELLL